MKQIHELLGYKNIKIVQDDDMFSFSVDSMLLADFIKATSKTKKIVDLCCGNAPIPLFLTLKTKASIIGVEIQKDVYDLAIESIELNNLTNQISIINDDLKGIYKKIGANQYDIVSCNPPYFKYQDSSLVNDNDIKTIARHEVKLNLEDVIKVLLHKDDSLPTFQKSVLREYVSQIELPKVINGKKGSTAGIK